MKTEAEILQSLKDFAKAKKLSVSEKTMQHRAAKLALKQLDEDAENAAITEIQEELEVIHANIRDERAKQKREDEEAFKATNPTPKTNDDGSGASSQAANQDPALKEALDWIREQKNASIAESKRKSVIEKVYKEGASKDDKTLIDKLISTHAITHETDEEDVVGKVLDIYNTIKTASAASGGLPKDTSGGKSSTELDKLIDESKKFL